MSNWHEITPSEFAWEREALRFVRDRFPRHEPFRAWSNFEFLAEGGQLYEVDLLVCSPRGLFVVEVKSWPGALAGDDHTLAWTDPDGRTRHRDHPLRLTNLKAKKLRSLLERQRAAREGGRRAVPFVRPIVFLSDPDVRLDLDPPGRTGVVVRERRSGVPGVEEALLDVTTADHERWRTRPQERLDRPAAKVVAGALEQAGVRPSNRLRRVGQYRLGELLGEGHGFQDFTGEHEQLAGVRRRVRIYSAAPDAPPERREQLRRAARRELALLEGADHRGILHAVELVDHELGPALVLDASPEAVRLDHWLAEHGARLPLLDRLALIRALAEPVGYAHGRRLVHRGLSPRSVLVVDADDPQLRRLKIGDWQTGASVDAAGDGPPTIAGTRHLEALVEPEAAGYLAPEAAADPGADGVALDVFSLGAIAFLVLTGQAPAPGPVELRHALVEGRGLDLAATLDGAGQDLRELVRAATHPEVPERLESVDAFLLFLADAERESASAAERDRFTDPAAARPGDRIDNDLVVRRRLGSGASALALLVDDEQAGEERVLKVALDAQRDAVIRDEGEVLDQLAHPAIVAFHGERTVAGRTALLLGFAAKGTIAGRLRADGPVGLELLERFGTDLLEAVRHLERMGFAHRDLKPDNLGLVELGRNRELHLVLFDFSLTRASVEAVGAGTPPYLDPFLAGRGRVDPAADRYAAAVTLHEMATGRTPRFGDGRSDPAVLDCEATVLTEALDPSVRAALGDFFARALRREAAERFDTADDMLTTWRRALERIGRPALEGERTLGADELDALLDEATPDTSLATAGLTAAQVAALERHNVVTVGDLVALPRTELNALRGLGNRMRRELAAAAGQLRARLGAPTPAPTTTTTSGEALHEPDVQALDGLVAQLVPDRAPDRDQAALQRLVLGLDDVAQEAGAEWPTPAQAVAARGAGAAAARAALDAGVRRWKRLPAVTRLRSELVELLDGLGGVASADELAALVLARRGAAVEDARRDAYARAATRAAIEVELARATEGDVVQRRTAHGGLLLGARAGGHDPDALLEVAVALGERADALAAAEPLAEPREVAAALRAVAGDATLGPSRLLALAGAASRTAAVSPRGELYPRDMAPQRALRLAQGALVGAHALTADAVRERVAARFPAAAPLPPDRGRLGALLDEAGIELAWRADAGLDRAGAFVPPSLPAGLTAFRGTSSTHRPGATHAADVVAFEGQLERARAEGGPLVLLVAPADLARAHAHLVERFTLHDVNLEALVLSHMRELSADKRVDWTLVVRADAEAPRGTHWSNLQRLLDLVEPRVEEELAALHGTLLLRNAGMLARYARLGLWSRLRGRFGAPGPHGAWLLVPASGQTRLPALDGQALEVLTPDEWARVPRAWVRDDAREAAA
jgi:serine/threonine protein kinase